MPLVIIERPGVAEVAVDPAFPELPRREGCPKRMVFGPCGGVRRDGRCELAESPCPFMDAPAPAWPSLARSRPRVEADPRPNATPTTPPATTPPTTPATTPVIVTDFTVAPFDAGSLRDVTRLLGDSADFVLVGDHQNRPDFPPSTMARLIAAAGGRPVITLTCRDRNRIALEQELRGLREAGVDTVLCVTGDGRGGETSPAVPGVFDLDGTRLAALARTVGLSVAVCESPQAPPFDHRVGRLLTKQLAGAQVCILNHVASPGLADRFITAARSAGVELAFIASVAVYTDRRSAEVLAGFPGLGLDGAAVEKVLSARDPVAAGIEAAVTEARRYLSIPGVSGVNLSGQGSSAGPLEGARVKAAVGRRVRS